MLITVAQIIVLLISVYLFSFGVISLIYPQKAAKFLLGFATRPALHYLEMLLRILAGAAFVRSAPELLVAPFFRSVGWILIATSIGLIALPWRWHQQFAKRAVPQALPHLNLIALSSCAFAVFIFYCVVAPML